MHSLLYLLIYRQTHSQPQLPTPPAMQQQQLLTPPVMQPQQLPTPGDGPSGDAVRALIKKVILPARF